MIESIETPIGTVHLTVRDKALCALGFGDPPPGERGRTEAGDRVRAFFAGDMAAFDGLRVELEGTPFQRRVWDLLREIRPGQTRSYADLARRLGSHPRAVGGANGANPVAIVIPCHRVIAADGSLCGYGWGPQRKRWLLDFELSATGAAGQASLPLAAQPIARKRAANSPPP